MEQKEKPLHIKLLLEGELLKRFEAIRDHLGVNDYTKIIRILINWYWKEYGYECAEYNEINRGGLCQR